METNKPNNKATTQKKSNYKLISEMAIGESLRWPIESMNVIRATAYKISRIEKKRFSSVMEDQELVLKRVE